MRKYIYGAGALLMFAMSALDGLLRGDQVAFHTEFTIGCAFVILTSAELVSPRN